MPLAEPNPARAGMAQAARSYRLALTATVGELERAEADYRFHAATVFGVGSSAWKSGSTRSTRA